MARACINCPRPAVPGTSRCERCGNRSSWGRYAAKHPERAEFYKSKEWREMRATQLRMNPDCELCGQPANQANHRVAVADDPSRMRDETNLQSLCEECHKKVTAEQNRKRRKGRPRDVSTPDDEDPPPPPRPVVG